MTPSKIDEYVYGPAASGGKLERRRSRHES